MNSFARIINMLSKQMYSKVICLYSEVAQYIIENDRMETNEKVCGLIFGDLKQATVRVLTISESAVVYEITRKCPYTGDVDIARFAVKDSYFLEDTPLSDIVDDLVVESILIEEKEKTSYLSNLLKKIARLDEADRKFLLDQFND